MSLYLHTKSFETNPGCDITPACDICAETKNIHISEPKVLAWLFICLYLVATILTSKNCLLPLFCWQWLSPEKHSRWKKGSKCEMQMPIISRMLYVRALPVVCRCFLMHLQFLAKDEFADETTALWKPRWPWTARSSWRPFSTDHGARW